MKALWLVLAAVAAHAAVIRGSVVENLTGKPLARAVIILQPIAGTPGDQRSMRATSLGGFEFDQLAAGTYVLRASRKGFMPAEYGQKRWNSAGLPVAIKENETAFLHFRLQRFGAISGTIVDENEIGLPDQEIAAYRLRTPPELVASAKADSRGGYRIHGLEPGAYVVRTIGKQYDDGAYLPTYAREAAEIRNGVRVDLLAEQEMLHVDVRPAPGRLFSVVVEGVYVLGCEVTLTMASDMGRKTVKAMGNRFTGLSVGSYDFYAESPCGNAYQRMELTKDAKVTLLPSPGGDLFVSGVPDAESAKLWIRRKDLAGPGETKPWPLTRGRATIPTGRWELFLTPPAGEYVASFYGGAIGRAYRQRADGWNEVVSGERRSMQFQLLGGASAVRGAVKASGEVAAGVPVYLEGRDATGKQRVGELRITRTDSLGMFRFDGLAPGSYRIVATFEYLNPDVETMDSIAQEILLTAHAEKAQELELYVIR